MYLLIFEVRQCIMTFEFSLPHNIGFSPAISQLSDLYLNKSIWLKLPPQGNRVHVNKYYLLLLCPIPIQMNARNNLGSNLGVL